MLVTKGGVLFTGDLRGRILAYDAKSGKELWKFQTGSGVPRSVRKGLPYHVLVQRNPKAVKVVICAPSDFRVFILGLFLCREDALSPPSFLFWYR